MYFISVNGLKAELVHGPMTARRALPYVCTWLALMTLAANPQVSGNARPAEWDWLITLYSALAVVIGVLIAYRANGGRTESTSLQGYSPCGGSSGCVSFWSCSFRSL